MSVAEDHFARVAARTRGEQLRAMYYVTEPRIRTMADFVELLRTMEQFQ